MNGIEYYKSLISDEEVIKALVKESKARNELLKEKTRMRPNLNFFQRTVTNLVTSNKRVNTTKELLFKEKEVSGRKLRGKVKTPDTSIKEITTTNKTNNVKSEDEVECGQSTKPTNFLSPVEETYKDALNKYFVPAVEENTNSKSIKIRKFAFNSTAKPKTIVFNLNFGKQRLEKPVTESVVSKPSYATSVVNCEDNDSGVIQISDSETD